MAEWSDVAEKAIDLAQTPRRLILLVSAVLSVIALAILGIFVYYHYQPKKSDTPIVRQENKGDRNQQTGVNNGTMNQVNP